jgi:Zn-dependent peptidase ImmA (M78 family)
MARRLVLRYALRSPEDIDVETLAMAEGVLVMEGALVGADARLVRGRRRGLVRVRQDIPEEGRRRLAIAHELGHWLLHQDATQLPLLCEVAEGVTDPELFAAYRASALEIEATTFASELLLPGPLFEPLCATLSEELSLEDVKALAARFRTTLTATAVRLVQAVPHGFVAFSTAEGVAWWKRFEGRGGPGFLWLRGKQPVDPRSRPGRCHQGESDTERVEVPLDSWFGHLTFRRPVRLFEQAMRLGAYDTVLSLLTVRVEG